MSVAADSCPGLPPTALSRWQSQICGRFLAASRRYVAQPAEYSTLMSVSVRDELLVNVDFSVRNRCELCAPNETIRFLDFSGDDISRSGFESGSLCHPQNPKNDGGEPKVQEFANGPERMNDGQPPVMKIAPAAGVWSCTREMPGVSRLPAGLAKAAKAFGHARCLEFGRILVPELAITSAFIHDRGVGPIPKLTDAGN